MMIKKTTTSSSSCLEGRSFGWLVVHQVWPLLCSYSSSLSLLPFLTVHPTDGKSLPNQHLQRLASMPGDGVVNFSSRCGLGLARPMESAGLSGFLVLGEVLGRGRWPL